ncbi:hypothetical protein NP493_131g03032 [Ridgeia piscesae]|uniref:Laminin IV type A domain-containing protein n=1 Tax=Ridgeia piscesae TaxID=27915 RepID=A0AAD9UGH2_RIDPI|nr:hypothetical protein NP493_131g03032 [Ridgeia piscesae]
MAPPRDTPDKEKRTGSSPPLTRPCARQYLSKREAKLSPIMYSTGVFDGSIHNWTQTQQGRHITAPDGYLGDKQHSYGQLLRFSVKSAAGVSVPLTGQSVVTMQGNGQSVHFQVDNVTAVVDSYREVEVMLHETLWRYNETSRPNTFSFYAILADLMAIYIRRLYAGGVVSITDVHLMTARHVDTASTWVTFVENCTCDVDRNVSGLSCASCDTGHRRSIVNGSAYDACTACDCSQRSETTPPLCSEATGDCLNCRNGTAGPHCSQCAAHVFGAECNLCELGFWGLGRDGCEGRTCDVCVENYVNLTSSGCSRCESCFDLVMAQVEAVREMRRNLTALLGQLLSQEMTADMGQFRWRLDRVVADTQRLLLYLAETERVNATASTQMIQLNTSLQGVTDTLDNSTDVAVDVSTSRLRDTQSALTTATHIVQEVNNTLTLLVPQRSDIWQLYLGPVQQLVDNLTYVERTLVAMSQSSMGNTLRMASVVQNIVSESTTALTMARNARNMTTASYRLIDNTTHRISDLEQFVVMVTNKSKKVVNGSDSCTRSASLAWQVAVATRQNVTDVGDVDTAVVKALEKETKDIRNKAFSLNIRALNANSNSQSVRRDVRAAGQRTASLLVEVSVLKNQSEGLFVRSFAANQNAVAAEGLGGKSFRNASRMLDIMRDFTARASAVEQKATKSLLTVALVRAVSEKATQAADQLRKSLQGTRQMSSEASLTAVKARDSIISETQSLVKAMNSSLSLKLYSDTVLNEVNLEAKTVSAINASDVAPAATQCSTIQPQLTDMQAKVTRAASWANKVLRDVDSTHQRIETVATDLRQVDNIDVSKVTELKQLISRTRENFDQRLLEGAVKLLSAAVVNQRRWLEAMNVRKQSLQRQIRSMRDLHEQLTP